MCVCVYMHVFVCACVCVLHEIEQAVKVISSCL